MRLSNDRSERDRPLHLLDCFGCLVGKLPLTCVFIINNKRNWLIFKIYKIPFLNLIWIKPQFLLNNLIDLCDRWTGWLWHRDSRMTIPLVSFPFWLRITNAFVKIRVGFGISCLFYRCLFDRPLELNYFQESLHFLRSILKDFLGCLFVLENPHFNPHPLFFICVY